MITRPTAVPRRVAAHEEMTAFAVLSAISVAHLLNDTIQSLLPAIYPMLKAQFGLTFGQIGLMTLALMLTASVLQPLVGFYTDKRPTP
jgi:MFS transporter, FSR family, fosmidomycin resistance protein